MVRCLVGVGSNLGQRDSILDQSVQLLQSQTIVLACSQWYSYPSVGPFAEGKSQPDYLNGVVLIESPISAQATAQLLHELEHKAGRVRTTRWSSRTLDADLLLYGDQVIQTEDLIVPHPRMMSRRFVLEPAAEVAGDMVHPVVGWTMQKAWEHLLNAQPFFVVLGDDDLAAAHLAKRLADATNGSSFTLPAAWASSGAYHEAVESLQQPIEAIAQAIRDGQSALRPGPWFANFWTGDRWALDDVALQEKIASVPRPKLILLVGGVNSQRAQQVAQTIRRHPELRVPAIQLSPNESEAWQDALGAVQGMQ